MIRNKIDGQDVPMRLAHEPHCMFYNVLEMRPDRPVHVHCICDPKLVVDTRQQRLEHKFCPDCPVKLTNKEQKRSWFGCHCCHRAWRLRKDGRFDEQVPLSINDSDRTCGHHAVAGPTFSHPPRD